MISAPPLDVITPPLCAVFDVRFTIKLLVVITGTVAGVSAPPLTQPFKTAIIERKINDVKTLANRGFFTNTYKELLLFKNFIINRFLQKYFTSLFRQK